MNMEQLFLNLWSIESERRHARVCFDINYECIEELWYRSWNMISSQVRALGSASAGWACPLLQSWAEP
jgi:hypothetical protein